MRMKTDLTFKQREKHRLECATSRVEVLKFAICVPAAAPHDGVFRVCLH